MIRRIACGILFKTNKILLGKRSKNRDIYPGVWDFIGGHCEGNESYEDAMNRELTEEIGIEPIDYKLIKMEKSPQFIMAIYMVKKWEGTPYNKDLKEHEIIKWVSFSEAKTLGFPDCFPYSKYNEILNLIEAEIV